MTGILRSIFAIFIVLTILILALSGTSGGFVSGFTDMLLGPFSSALAFGNFLETTAKLILAGLAASMAFSAGCFNLGGEGQVLAGGLAATAVAVCFPELPRGLALTLALGVGFCAGGIIGTVSGALKAKWQVDELISTFLISAAILNLGDALLVGSLKDADSYLIAAPPLPSAYRLLPWWPPSRLSAVLIWAVLLIATTHIFLRFTIWGYRWRLRKASNAFASYVGINTGSIAVVSLAASGALYGLAGVAALMDSGQAIQGFTSNLGWDGLAIALVAGTRPIWVPVFAIIYTWIILGAQTAMLNSGFSFALSGLVQAVIFFLVTAKRFEGRNLA